MSKRNILGGLMEGVAAMKSQRQGKLTLRSFKVEPAPLSKVDSKLIRDTRKRLHCSRAVFARMLRINKRTREKWEQGLRRIKPSEVLYVSTFLRNSSVLSHAAFADTTSYTWARASFIKACCASPR